MKKSTTRRALFMSVASMFLCFTMLLGTTYAWFTDSVESGVNQIVAGNLDVELYNGDVKITGADNDPEFFDDVKKWEPGAMAWETFTVKNVGDLALKYQLEFVLKEDAAAAASLADVLKIAVIDGELENADTRIDTSDEKYEWKPLANYAFEGTLDLTNATEDVRTFIIWWEPSDLDNNYNINNGNTGKASVSFALNLFATQMEAEFDSFGDDYDADSPMKPTESWDGTADEDLSDNVTEEKVLTISTAEEFAAFAAEVNAGVNDGYQGWTINLASNIDLLGKPWTPIGNGSNGFKGTFDGNGYTVYNLNVEGKTSIGLFGYALNGGNIKNLTVENATVKADDYAGAILGRGYTDVVNCHAKNVTVTVTPFFDEAKGVYDGGAKAGAVVGQLLEGAGNTVVGCTATNVYIKGYRDLGGVLGMAHNNNTVENCSATDVTIEYVSVDGIYDDGVTPNQNAGAIVGRINASATVDDATLAGNKNFTLVKKATASTIAELTTAIAEGATEIDLAAGEYAMISTSADVTITGTKDTKVELPFKSLSGYGNTITFRGITVYGANNGSFYSDLFIGAEKVVFEDCAIYDQISTFCDVEFINCDFYNTFANDYSVYCYYGNEISFEGCTFNTECGKAIKVYDEGNGGRTVKVNECTFNATNFKKAAVEIDSTNSTYYVYIDNCKLEGAFTALWNSDPGEDAKTNVCLDGAWVKGSAPAAQ